MNTVRIGMASGDVTETYLSKWPVHDPLQACVCYVDNGQTRVALISIDFCYLSPTMARNVRERLAAQCGLSPDDIVLHPTHNHTSPEEIDIYPDRLADCLATIIKTAQSQAQPALMAYAEVDTGRQFNINRRKQLEGIGTFTLWLGYEDRNGEPDGGPLNRARLAHWMGRPIADPKLLEPMIYDGPTDGLIQGVFFQTLDHRPIGSIFRYAAHPCIAGHTTQRHYSADYPGQVKRRMEAAFGGPCCFLSGPCGNIAPWEKAQWPEPSFPTNDLSITVPWMPQKDPAASFAEAQRIGNALVDAFLPHIPGQKTYQPCERLKFVPHELTLPIREDLLNDLDEAKRQAGQLRDEFHRIRKIATPKQLKYLADRINFLEHHSCFYELYHYLTQEQYRKRQVTACMPILALDDVIFLGLPAEVFWQTPQPAFQLAKSRNQRLISFTEANGDIGYIPTESERPNGDYECICSILAAGAETTIAETARQLVANL